MRAPLPLLQSFVRFPVDDPAWRASGEGALVVKLLAVARGPGTPDGTEVFDRLKGVLIGDDREAAPRANQFTDDASLDAERAAHLRWVRRLYPGYGNGETPGEALSVPLYAALTLGAAQWTGFSGKLGRYWSAHRSELTETGTALASTLEFLYPGAQLHLLTFLQLPAFEPAG